MNQNESKPPLFTLEFGQNISKEDYQKNVYPEPIISKWGGVAAITAGIGHVLNNNRLRIPIYARLHVGIFYASFSYWFAYNFTQWHGRYYLGKYKYSLDYLLNCDDTSVRTLPKKFSHPDILTRWNPNREAYARHTPVKDLKMD